MTNTEVQDTLAFAVYLLREERVILPGNLNVSVATWLDHMATYSASGNNIPARAGLGLEEALATATSVINIFFE